MAVNWIQAREILDEALQIPVEDRSRYLDRRNMPTAECQKSGVEGKVLGLHSTVFSESDRENKRLNHTN